MRRGCINCRPREKINKPMLRNRRRGNDADSLLKLQTIRHNQLDAIKVVQFLIKRERKKRDITVRSQCCCATMLLLATYIPICWASKPVCLGLSTHNQNTNVVVPI